MFDRKKDMLNRGGYKIYSVEVENVLMAWPGMVEAAIVGRPCPVLGERVHAFVHAPGSRPTTPRCGASAPRAWPTTRCPKRSAGATQPLPRNANGKLMKRLLRETAAPCTLTAIEV